MTNPWRPRPDRGSPPHDRAGELIVERLDGPLEPDDAAWLDSHFTGCHACRALGEAFEADRAELRSLRRQPIEPPRDLWARTSAALEHEARSRRSQRRRPAPAPMGAAAGLLVVAVVIGATLLSGRQSVTPDASFASPSPSSTLFAVSLPPSVAPTASSVASPEATRMSVPSGDVPYLAQDDEGNNVLLQLGVSEVCSTNGADCAPIAPSSPRVLELPNAPRAVIQSPDEEQLVVVDEGAKGEGGTITLVPIPTPDGSADPPSTQPPVTSSPTPPSPTPPSPTPSPTTPSPTAPVTPSPTPTPTPAVTTSPTPSDEVTPPPTEPPNPSPSATPTETPTETLTPSPSATATATAIAEDVVVDGTSAAFSADGRFLAYSARPADGSHGPDIYLWPTDGDEPARPITTDHRSVFAGWLGDAILGSRVVEESDGSSSPAASASFDPDVRRHGASFVVDPATGTITDVPGRALWRPSVDPTGSRAVYWDGELRIDETGNPLTEIGRLVLGPWTAALTGGGSPAPSGAVHSREDPEPTSPLPSVGGSDPSSDAGLDVLAEGPIVDWDARWDETGTRLAVWIADPDDPTIGKLTLYAVHPETGRLNADLTALRDERALPGFAIGQGRLVWATPPGQNAEASHVRVLAWTADGVGQVESRPAEDIVVIR